MSPATYGTGRVSVGIAVLLAALAPALGQAQQVVEIDFANGRDVINDERRAIHLSPVEIDHGRGALYVRDAEEPEGIMVFSLATGERLRTYTVQRGEGPGELQVIHHFALASEGGLYVSGNRRVIELNHEGAPIGTWSAWGTPPRALCEFGGRPTIAVQGGLKRRGSEGGDDFIGTARRWDTWMRREGNDEDVTEVDRWMGARLACADDLAFLVLPRRTMVRSGRIRRESFTGSDSIVVYSDRGEESTLAVPTEYADDRAWNRNMTPSLDTRGNLVVAGGDGRVPGAIIDPETRCYAVLRNGEYQWDRELLGVYQDSALVFHRDYEETTAEGRRRVTLYADARQVSLNPLRHVAGPPCPGMLTSVPAREALEPDEREQL